MLYFWNKKIFLLFDNKNPICFHKRLKYYTRIVIISILEYNHEGM